MSEQLLSALLGKTTSGEPLLGMSSKRTENPLQANLGEESFNANLAYSVKNMAVSNNKAPASIAPRLTLSNQEDINLIMEMVSKGILPDIAGLREQLNQELNNNMNKETFINNGNNNIPDSKTTPVSTQLHTLLVNSEGTLSPAKSMNLNGEEMSSLAKAMKNGEETSSLAKAMQNSEEVSSLAKSVKSGEEISSSAKPMKNGEEILSPTKSVKSNGEKILSPTKSVKLNGEKMSSSAKSMKNGEETSSVEKSAGSSEEVSFLAKAMNGQNLRGNTGNKISEQLASQDANKTVPEESNVNLSEDEGSELHQALNVSKSQDVTTSFNDSNILSNARSDESTIQTTVSQDNSFLNNQGSDTAKESNVSLTNIKQGIEPKVSFANISRQINVTQPFESLGVDLVDNFMQRARLFMQGDKSTIRLQLNPPELGSLKLEFTVEDDVLEAKIFVERSVVKEIIEKDIPRLRELIADTEVGVGKLDVFLQEKEDEGLNFMNEGFLSDSGSNQTQEFTDQEREDFDDGVNEELELNVVSPNIINYLA
ncbi:MAG: flagellar hook-length control protein FliK [Candidatus Scalindua sp.]